MNKTGIASLVTALPPRNNKLYNTSISKIIHPLHLTPYTLRLTTFSLKSPGLLPECTPDGLQPILAEPAKQKTAPILQ